MAAEIFCLGLTCRSGTLASLNSKLLDRHLIPLIFSYIEECPRKCWCRVYKKTMKSKKIVYYTRVLTLTQSHSIQRYSDLIRHVKCVSLTNCNLKLDINGNILDCNVGPISDLIPLICIPYSQLTLQVTPIETDKPYNAVIEYEEMYLLERNSSVIGAIHYTEILTECCKIENGMCYILKKDEHLKKQIALATQYRKNANGLFAKDRAGIIEKYADRAEDCLPILYGMK